MTINGAQAYLGPGKGVFGRDFSAPEGPSTLVGDRRMGQRVPALQPTRVLVVDDDRRVLDFLDIKLRASGYEVATADNGAAALKKMVAFRPDVLVMDVAMPDKNGFETLREAREFTQAPAILISGYDVETADMQNLGRVQYLPKPFNPDDLLMRIEALRRPDKWVMLPDASADSETCRPEIAIAFRADCGGKG